MSERQKTMVAAAVLAAAIGVYLEISYQAKMKEKAGRQQQTEAPAGPASVH